MTTLSQRLEQLRKKYPDNWRAMRRYAARPSVLKRSQLTYSNDHRWLIVEFDDSIFRIHSANNFIRLDHTGFYCGEFQDDSYQPIVATCHTSRGLLIVPGYFDTCSGQYILSWSSRIISATVHDGNSYENPHYDYLRDLAHRADYIAEREAEKSREYYRMLDIEQDISAMFSDDYSDIRARVLTIIQAIRSIRDDLVFDFELQELPLREELISLAEERTEFFRKISEKKDEIAYIKRYYL